MGLANGPVTTWSVLLTRRVENHVSPVKCFKSAAARLGYLKYWKHLQHCMIFYKIIVWFIACPSCEKHASVFSFVTKHPHHRRWLVCFVFGFFCLRGKSISSETLQIKQTCLIWTAINSLNFSIFSHTSLPAPSIHLTQRFSMYSLSI